MPLSSLSSAARCRTERGGKQRKNDVAPEIPKRKESKKGRKVGKPEKLAFWDPR
jgi:hypothetical protein